MAAQINQFTKLIASHRRIGIDSMCFLYQFSDHPQYGELTQSIFNLTQKGLIHSFTSVISVIEALILPEKQQDILLIHEYEKFFQHLPNLKLIPVDWNTARLVSKLRAKYPSIKTPDSIQIASALLQDCSLFITNDKQLKQVSEIKIKLLKDFI